LDEKRDVDMEATGKTNLTEEKETLFITLYAKALDYQSKRSILHDKKADEILRTVDPDLSKYKGFGNSVTVLRARHFDEWIREFTGKLRNAVVLNLGCGLDTRVSRINPSSSVSWFDVDYPEVIRLRKSFYRESDNYRMLASSVTSDGWLVGIPTGRPALIIAEGLVEYLTADEVRTLLQRLTGHFHHGQIIFDVMNSFAINAGKKKLKESTGAVHKWAVDDIREVDQLNPELKRMDAIPIFDSPYASELSRGLRFMINIFSVFSSYRNLMRLLRYRF
jgi:O-methyltransferase involved in polyketide biosynthesis